MNEKKIGNIYGFEGGNFAGNVYSCDGLSPSINTCQGGGREPMICDTKRQNRLAEWEWQVDGETYTVRIRKFTPKECWRLMGFSDDDFEKAEQVNSNTQLYKQAGNSIVVDVLEAIFRQLIER